MSTHIGALPKQIAPTVLMPGDPRRAKNIADQYMEDRLQYNEIRNMWGYTGTTEDGKRFSVQGGGMGQPSIAIYSNELFLFHEVETIIRIGTFGSYQKNVPCRSIFIPETAITDSNMFSSIIKARPSLDLFNKAMDTADKFGIKVYSGEVFSSDVFYDLKGYKEGEQKDWEILAGQGTIGVEMESHALFCVANHYKKQALTILVASDNLVTGEKLSPSERENSIGDAMKIALELI